MAQAMALDQRERPLGVEARLEDEQGVDQHRLQRVHVRRAVVERRRHEGAHAGLQAHDRPVELERERALLVGRRVAAHALRPAGRP